MHIPASSFHLVDFITLTPSNMAIQGLKVPGAGHGHHHSAGELGEDGEGEVERGAGIVTRGQGSTWPGTASGEAKGPLPPK